MKAIIPVAGVGTRMRPHTLVIPKVLLNVGGKPVLSHIIDRALESGIDDMAFIIGYRGRQIRDFIDSRYSFTHTFYEQSDMLGLAYAVSLAEDYLKDDPVFIILGDTIFDVDLSSVFNNQYSSLGVKTVRDPRRYGTAEVNEEGFVTTLTEKPTDPKSNLALVGLYYVTRGAILKDAIKKLILRDRRVNGEYQITDAFQIMANDGEKITTFPVDGWYDCGKPESMLASNQHLLAEVEQKFSYEGSLIRPPVFIGDDVTIENSIIGPYTTIARSATVSDAILVNTIIGEGATVKDISLTDSIIGSRASISGSFNTLNISDFSEITL